MRADLCLALALFLSGCFLNHGQLDKDAAKEAEPVDAYLCSLAPAREYPRALTLHRFWPGCGDRPVDRCSVSEIDADLPRFRLDIAREEGPVDGRTCGTVGEVVETASCDVPIRRAGDVAVDLSDTTSITMRVATMSPDGPSCWGFGGRCASGVAPDLSLGARIRANRPMPFRFVQVRNDVGAPRSCEVTAPLDWTADGPAPLRMVVDWGPSADDCEGWGREVDCVLPPLALGSYELWYEGAPLASLVVG